MTVLLRKLYSSRLMSSKLPSKMPATERQLRATKQFNKSTSRIGQCNKVAGYPRYLAKVGDGDHYTNLWKMLQSTSKKLAKRDYAVIPLDLQTPVSTSMPPAIDPNMVLMMNAKEGQPAYWRNGENGLEFVQWAAPVQTPDSRLQSAKDCLVVKVVQIKNCEERLALCHCLMKKTLNVISALLSESTNLFIVSRLLIGGSAYFNWHPLPIFRPSMMSFVLAGRRERS